MPPPLHGEQHQPSLLYVFFFFFYFVNSFTLFYWLEILHFSDLGFVMQNERLFAPSLFCGIDLLFCSSMVWLCTCAIFSCYRLQCDTSL